MRKAVAGVLLAVLVSVSACSTTKGVRTARHIDPSTQDSTVVLVVKEEYEETTVYPWNIFFGIVGVAAAIAYAIESK